MELKFLLPSIFLLFLSCGQSTEPSKPSFETEENDSIDKSEILQDEATFPISEVDTLIGEFQILYAIYESDEIISKSGIDSEGNALTIDYEDYYVVLELLFEGGTVLPKTVINKYSFRSIIPDDEIKDFTLNLFAITKVSELGVLFFVNNCIPDTDICYPVDFFVSNKGEFTVTAIDY